MNSMSARIGLVWAVAGLAVLSLTACQPHRELLERHQAAEALWEEGRPVEYSYRFHRLCECSEEYLREALITVSHGSITQVTYTDDGSTIPQEEWDRYRTVEGLFAAIVEAAGGDVHEITVEYDTDLGYPHSIFIDYDERLMDEEKRWYANDLEALSGS